MLVHPIKAEDSGERSASQNVNLLLQRGLHVQTKHGPAQAEIPTGLKHIAQSFEEIMIVCVSQASLGFITRFPLWSGSISFLSTWPAYSSPVITRRQGQGATCHAVWSRLFAEVKLRQMAEMKYSLLLSCGQQ